MSRTLLVDADLLAYRASAGTQSTYHWDGPEGPKSVAAHLDQAQEAAEAELNRLIDRLKPDELIVCLSDDFSSFRKNLVDPGYKEVRATVERPVYLYELKDWLRSEYLTQERPHLEADDVMGILATEPRPSRDERIIVSADKDLMTVPGRLFRPQLQVGQSRPLILDIEPLDAVRFHFYQTVVGDNTDGYRGAPGVGPKSIYAEEILEAESEEEAWEWVLAAFWKAGLDEDDAVTQARLARILQHQDYDGRSPILWLPPYSGECVY